MSKIKARDRALSAMHDYLVESGWKIVENVTKMDWGFYIDPLMRQPHRGDFAFFVQTERDLNELLTKAKQ